MATAKKSTAAKKTPAAKSAKPAAKKPAAQATKASKATKAATTASKPPAKATKATKSTKAPAKATKAKATASSDQGGSGLPAVKGTTKDGIAYTKDFDVKFLKAQKDLLQSEREQLVGQATRLEDEANSLIEDGEMGDVQFDDESGEGDTMVVERERDLALSAQARQTVVEIDAAFERLAAGSYGYSLVSGKPIPRERLQAIPWATELVEEKVGGLGR